MSSYYLRKIISIISCYCLSLKRNVTVGNIRKCLLSKGAKITARGKVNFGYFHFAENVLVSSATPESELSIGRNSFINRNTIIACRNRISIGDDVVIGPNVIMYDHDHNYGPDGRFKESAPNPYKIGEIVIGNNVWIGGGVSILRNTTIGNNCVIGAGVVLKGIIPDNSIVVSETKNRIIPFEEKFGARN